MDCSLLYPGDFPGTNYWSGLLFPSPGNLTDPGIEPVSAALAGGFFTGESPGKPSRGVSSRHSLKKKNEMD